MASADQLAKEIDAQEIDALENQEAHASTTEELECEIIPSRWPKRFAKRSSGKSQFSVSVVIQG